MRKFIFILFMIIYWNSNLFAISTADYEGKRNKLNLTIYGYANPMDGFVGATLLKAYFAAHYYGGKKHLGTDIMNPAGTKIYSICDGIVKESQDMTYKKGTGRNNYNAYWTSRVIIQCEKPKCLVIYGHVDKVSVSKNNKITKGQPIGELAKAYYINNKRYTANDHLHFGINIHNNITYNTYWGFGIGPSSATRVDASNKGFKDPFEFLTSNIVNDEATIINKGIFDGAGSIIDPSAVGDGLNKDIAVMHSHTPDNSTIVFQWQSSNNSNSCKYLDILTENGEDLGDVTVTTRGWNSAFPNTQNKEIFEVKLDKEAFSIKKDSKNTGWTLISITSKKPLSTNDNWIRAKCSNNSFKTKNRKYLLQNDFNTDDNKLVSVTHDYWWSGNGSIISSNNKNNDSIPREQYGIDHDSAISYSGHNSFTAFQWQTNYKCQKLKIGVQDDWKASDKVAYVQEVKIKPWSAKDWDSQTLCNGKLPCIIQSPKISNDGHNIDYSNYYIIKIKSKAGSIPSNDGKRYIKAECVN